MPTPDRFTLVNNHGDVMIELPGFPAYRINVHFIGDSYAPVLLQRCCDSWWYTASVLRCQQCKNPLSTAHLLNGDPDSATLLQWVGELYTDHLSATLWVHEFRAALQSLTEAVDARNNSVFNRFRLAQAWADAHRLPVL